MSDELTELQFSIHDVIDGKPLTPQTVDLPTLRGFLEEVEDFIKGNENAGTLSNSRVSIEEGSVKVVTLVGSLLAANAQQDLSTLSETGDLDSIQPKRAAVIEKWQSRTQRYPERVYLVGADLRSPTLTIRKNSQFKHDGENAWVEVEKYLTGKVVDLGGKQNPNVHLEVIGMKGTLQVSASEEQLAAESENQIYRDVTLYVQAEQHLKTRLLRKFRLIRFVPQTKKVDESSLKNLWAKGREAWSDVKSVNEWVEELRGSN